MYATNQKMSHLNCRGDLGDRGLCALVSTLLSVEQELHLRRCGTYLGAYVIEGDEVRAFDMNLRCIDAARTD